MAETVLPDDVIKEIREREIEEEADPSYWR